MVGRPTRRKHAAGGTTDYNSALPSDATPNPLPEEDEKLLASWFAYKQTNWASDAACEVTYNDQNAYGISLRRWYWLRRTTLRSVILRLDRSRTCCQVTESGSLSRLNSKRLLMQSSDFAWQECGNGE